MSKPDTPRPSVDAEGFAVTLRFYEELNDFLPHKNRKRDFSVHCLKPRTIKDLVESQGVPHTEIDLILIDGQAAALDQLLCEPCRISVYPVFETFDIAEASRLGRPPLRDLRFIADVHLGKLVRILRLLGFDCVYEPPWDDQLLAERSAAEHRVMLTRDKGLLKRSVVTHGIFLHSDDPETQAREVVRRLDLARTSTPFTRCTACNAAIMPVRRDSVAGDVPERTFAATDEYFRCTACAKVYWKGTHWPRLRKLIDRVLAAQSW